MTTRERVRTKTGVPVASDFDSPLGTPIVIDDSALTGGGFYMDEDESIVELGEAYYINVKKYGAVGDGSTDDTSAITAAIAAAVSKGRRRVYFPQGTYKTTTALGISGDMTLIGDGPSTSIIVFSPASALNCINYAGVTTIRGNDKLEVLHLGFRADSSNAVAAIYGAWTISGTGAIAAQPCILVCDVEVGSNSASAAFSYGLSLQGANHGTIEKLVTYHYQSGAIKATSYGVALDGLAGSPNLTDFKVRDCTFHYGTYGVFMRDVEGVHINQNTFLSCEYGVFADTTLTIGKPYLDITGNHFNCGIYGVYINEMVQFLVADNNIYLTKSISSAATVYGIYVASGSITSGVNLNSTIRDNVILASEDSGTFTNAYGVYIAGGTGTGESVLIKGTRSINCDRLIYLDASATNVVVLDDNFSWSLDAWEDAAGVNSLPYGVHTPTGYGVTNCADGDITEYESKWSRTGDQITVYGDVDVNPTAANTLTTFRLTTPFSVDLASATAVSGVICPSGVDSPSGTATLHTATSPDRVEFNVYVTFDTNTRFSYTYRLKVS